MNRLHLKNKNTTSIQEFNQNCNKNTTRSIDYKINNNSNNTQQIDKKKNTQKFMFQKTMV